MENIENKIKIKAKELGYDNCGIIALDSFSEFSEEVERRLTLFPNASEFYSHMKALADVNKSFDWAKSIVVCSRKINNYKIPDNMDKYIGKSMLFDERVEHSPEQAMDRKFEEFFIDNGIKFASSKHNKDIMQHLVPERWAAAKAGLGKFRSNNFIYTENGSWINIKSWILSEKLSADTVGENFNHHCPHNCNKCVKACPTGALSAPYTMDATKCIAFLIFNPDLPFNEELLKKMGTHLYGCDACQNACPANRNKWAEKEVFEEPYPIEDLMNLENLFMMSEKELLEKVYPRFFYIAKNNMWLWKFHAIRVMANENPIKYKKYFKLALEDSNPKIQQVAEWALKKLSDNNTK